MIIKSVQVGLPKEVMWNGKPVLTAIFKDPVEGPVEVMDTHLNGDKQADPRYHGGPDKSIYLYPFEHYAFWEETLGKSSLPKGIFGENLTTEGMLEKEVRVGDIYRFGNASLMAIQPRMPCFKLGVRFQDASMTQQFFKAERFGIYFRVIETGMLQAGNEIQLLKKSDSQITIQDIVDNFTQPKEEDKGKILQILESPIIPESLKASFRKRVT